MNPDALAAASGLATTAPAALAPETLALARAAAELVPPWVVAVSLLPFALVLLTAFARISLVLAFLRHGLGLPDVPSGTVVAGLAALLSLVAMAPVLEEARREAGIPWAEGRLGAPEALARAAVPLARFMDRATREAHRVLFVRLLAERGIAAEPTDPGVRVPAFVLSELVSGFQLGLVVWAPFLAVDLALALLLSVAGLAIEARTLAVPAKLLLFLAADGWALLAAGLVRAYGVGP